MGFANGGVQFQFQFPWEQIQVYRQTPQVVVSL
jgi:hypothetical protein